MAGRPSRVVDRNSSSGAKATSFNAVYLGSTVPLFDIANSVVHFGHDQGPRMLWNAPGVVETQMTKSMPVHDFRTEGDYTGPEQTTDFAAALTPRTLDTFTGRYVRTGADTEEPLIDEVSDGISAPNRRPIVG